MTDSLEEALGGLRDIAARASARRRFFSHVPRD